MSSSSDPVKYEGGCHCGDIQYTVSLPRPLSSLPTQVTSCNCSICQGHGYLLVYPKPEDVEFTKGSMDEMPSYGFNKKIVAHRFCPKCASSLFIDARDKFGFVGTNIRFFKNVELKDLEFNHVDNRGDQQA